MVICGVDSNKDVHPILVDANGRVYVNLYDPASVTQSDTVVTHPDGIGTFGRRDSTNAWREMPVAAFSDGNVNKGDWIVPVTPMTAEKEEGVKITDGTTTAKVDPDLEALLTVPIEHNLIHDGVVFACFHSFLLVPSATSRSVSYTHLTLPTNREV